MDDPLVQKSLKDAITMVGTCRDMCPRYERYRRERENNLNEWETIPGTKRVDHKRAVKMYERAAGDKTLPSDLRPPKVLKRTLDYLFHDLLARGGFSATFSFIRDRSRAVRNDFTMQHEMGPLAIECHDRCARFHILAIHLERDSPGFSIALEEQQLMYTLQSLKEFYEDQRGRYQSLTELEMRVYHRLIHIRDQKERHEDIPEALLNHPVFKLTTKFRARVQEKSAPITRNSPLTVDVEAMEIFAELANVLHQEGNVIMTYLIACILERLFGKDTIEDIEAIRGDLSNSDVIDGYSGPPAQFEDAETDVIPADQEVTLDAMFVVDEPSPAQSPHSLEPSRTQWQADNFEPNPTKSAFFNVPLTSTPAQSIPSPTKSVFASLSTVPNVFGTGTFGVPASSETSSSNTSPFTLNAFKDSTISALNRTPSVPGGFPNVSAPATDVSSAEPCAPKPDGQLSQATSTNLPSFSAAVPVFNSQLSSLQSSQTNGFSGTTNQPPLIFGAQPPTPGSPAVQPYVPSLETNPFIPSVSSGATTSSASSFSVKDVTPFTQRIDINTDSNILSLPSHISSRQEPLSTSNPPLAPTTSIPDQSLLPLDTNIATPPNQPPLLSRRLPISLPPTPTPTVFIPPSLLSSKKPASIFASLKSLQTSSLSPAPTEILSPLIIPSPSTSRSFPSVPHLLRRDSNPSPLRAAVSNADSEVHDDKPKAPTLSRPDQVERVDLAVMEATALKLARKCILVKTYFSRWRQRLSDRAKWLEACRRSQAYSEKVQAERLSRVDAAPTSEKKQKLVPTEPRTHLKSREKKRPSLESRPQTDEELARRFEKNHEEHERRWARGSFLRVLRVSLDSPMSPLPSNWAVWLSLNQENDGTAIWLEQKFDIPNSGKWKSENVFEMPVSSLHVDADNCYPGVVVFERTPLTGIPDVLEKKYRVLDDCARLREILKAFPRSRHYIPVLICISWSHEPPDVAKDFDDMVSVAHQDGLLGSRHELVVSSAALDTDSKFEELLKLIAFDRDGRLVKLVSVNDLFEGWRRAWDELTAWLAKCTIHNDFHWDFYASFLHAVVRLLCHTINSAVSLLRNDGVQADVPDLQCEMIIDSGSAFDAVLCWLEQLPPEVTLDLINDIKTHRNLGRDFPTLGFIPQLYTLAHALVAYFANLQPDAQVCVIKASMEETTKSIRLLKANFEDEFRASHTTRSRSSKRIPSDSTSDSAPAKKRRLSDSETSGFPEDSDGWVITSHEPSPSPSAATSVQSLDSRASFITPAMLRSLTKDIRAKYGYSTPSHSIPR
ncbi:SAC3/GANP/Nin1/mts3/eIF-3 p25 family-domain-containing protein [Scleroderma citrinum]